MFGHFMTFSMTLFVFVLIVWTSCSEVYAQSSFEMFAKSASAFGVAASKNSSWMLTHDISTDKTTLEKDSFHDLKVVKWNKKNCSILIQNSAHRSSSGVIACVNANYGFERV